MKLVYEAPQLDFLSAELQEFITVSRSVDAGKDGPSGTVTDTGEGGGNTPPGSDAKENSFGYEGWNAWE